MGIRPVRNRVGRIAPAGASQQTSTRTVSPCCKPDPVPHAAERAAGPQGSAPLAGRRISGRAFDAAIFDMDGVITDTASVHSAAWKRMFDEFLRHRERELGEPFREFTHTGDYRAYVDGKPRFEGVASFLRSRGIELPIGTTDDAPGWGTIGALGNRKNELFHEIVANEGVKVYESTVALIRALTAANRRVGLATSSRNSALILWKAGIAGLFETIVDGAVLERMRLKGKPAPDIFLAAAANLGVSPSRTVVVEDAVSGVCAGVAGGFGLVIGVAREGNESELAGAGAGLVVRDLAGVSVELVNQKVRGAAAER